MKLNSLDYVILLREDLARMKTFYHETLGFSIQRDWDDWIEMRAGAVLLTLRRRGRPYDEAVSPGSASAHQAFRVTPSDVDARYADIS